MTFGKHQESCASNVLVSIKYLIEESISLCYLLYQHFLYNTKDLVQYHLPPTGHRPPTTDHRPMDKVFNQSTNQRLPIH